jgi:hypothetical protein
MKLITLGYIALGLNMIGLMVHAGLFKVTQKKIYLMFMGFALLGLYFSALGIHNLTK